MAKKRSPIKRFFATLGPGVIAGAADDDPSGIATYSIAGAKLGLSLLWTALFIWPLMAAVQIMCARVGMVTGMGLMRGLKKKFPKPLILLLSTALFLANTINVGADLLGMADAAQELIGLKAGFFVLVFGTVITVASVKCSYYQIARVMKWLCLSLFAYVITGLILRPDWWTVARATLVPAWPHGHQTIQTVVAILGTSISPYLFVWQASEEVEEQKARGLNRVELREGATKSAIKSRNIDVAVGMFFSNLVMYFIILTTGLTLHAHGTQVETSRQAAEALRPLAGNLAATLYTIGIVGVGFLSIPTLAASAAYAFAETLAWRQGLNLKLKTAWRFYGVFALSMVAGMGMYFLKVNAVAALFWSAIINGILAPFMLLGLLLVASDRTLMKQQPSSKTAIVLVAATAVVMLAAAVGMFVF